MRTAIALDEEHPLPNREPTAARIDALADAKLIALGWS